MKTRIISAVVGLILFFCILAVSVKFNIVLLFALAVLSGIATYEMLHNTEIVKHKLLLVGSIIFSVIAPFCYFGIIPLDFLFLTVLFGFYLLAVSLKVHADMQLSELFSAFSVPVALALAFSSIYGLFIVSDMKHIHFAVIFAFAWGADTFAYFGGRFFGKHKLCPIISPKKTVEGFIGGIIGSVAVTLIILLCYSYFADVSVNIIYMTVFAVLFAPVGVMGDLSASLIKRSTGIKDYGNIMPGHGGVMDRFDSVLLIAPIYYAVLNLLNFA